ncbi:MAG: caspase family protein [Bacteroidia bacterium]|nr:caspase family protein [Bacteroidia bacterium]
MKRRALIIYCDDTESGDLTGPPYDNENFRNFLTSNLGGAWAANEILSLSNPNASEVSKAVNKFMSGADYTFTLFTGHGFINLENNKRQYLELADADISSSSLYTNAKRQTLIIDACRGFHSPSADLLKGFTEIHEQFIGDPFSTRLIFDRTVMRAEEGLTILYAASRNQTALDTDYGAAYLLSLLKMASLWEQLDKKNNILGLKLIHEIAANFLVENYDTIQVPTMNKEKRLRYFPFAVKVTTFHS